MYSYSLLGYFYYMYDVTALFLPFLSVIVFSQAYQYLYMPGDCWFYVTVQMFNIEKKIEDQTLRVILKYKNHPSIIAIQNKLKGRYVFLFQRTRKRGNSKRNP